MGPEQLVSALVAPTLSVFPFICLKSVATLAHWHSWQHVRPPTPDEITERRHWTQEEDDRLRVLVERYGERNWRLVASYLQDRLPKQCPPFSFSPHPVSYPPTGRERWINHLQDGISKGKITEQEWAIIVHAQKELGNKWSDIALLLPGRSPNQIKNFWHTTVRKQRAVDAKRAPRHGRKRKHSSEDEVDASSEYVEEGALQVNATHSDEEYRQNKRPRRAMPTPPTSVLTSSGPIDELNSSSRAPRIQHRVPNSGSFSMSSTDVKNVSTSDDEPENGLDVLSQMAEVHYNLLLPSEYKGSPSIFPPVQNGAAYACHPPQYYAQMCYAGYMCPPTTHMPHLMPPLSNSADFVLPSYQRNLASPDSSFAATSILYPDKFVGSSPQQPTTAFGVVAPLTPKPSKPSAPLPPTTSTSWQLNSIAMECVAPNQRAPVPRLAIQRPRQ